MITIIITDAVGPIKIGRRWGGVEFSDVIAMIS